MSAPEGLQIDTVGLLCGEGAGPAQLFTVRLPVEAERPVRGPVAGERA